MPEFIVPPLSRVASKSTSLAKSTYKLSSTIPVKYTNSADAHLFSITESGLLIPIHAAPSGLSRSLVVDDTGVVSLYDYITALSLKADLASPALTGNPTAPTQSAGDASTKIATTAYVDAATVAILAAQNVQVFKGVIDCSANPNYPAADAGHFYVISVAGKIGGGSGVTVEVGDALLCITDSSASDNQATVGANWAVLQTNINGAVVGPTSAVSGSIPRFSGTTGKLISDGGAINLASEVTGQLSHSSLQIQSSFSDATGALGTTDTFYSATVGSSYSKALSPSAGVADGTCIHIRIVSLTGTSLLTITPDGGDVIRHCGASLASIVLAKNGAELLLRKRDSGWDVVAISGRDRQYVIMRNGTSSNNGRGTTNTAIRHYIATDSSNGTACSGSSSATLGAAFTANEDGWYRITYDDSSFGSAVICGVSLNSTQLTTAINLITPESGRLVYNRGQSGDTLSCTTVVYLRINDVVRPHTDPALNLSSGNSADNQFRFEKIGE